MSTREHAPHAQKQHRICPKRAGWYVAALAVLLTLSRFGVPLS